MKSGIKGILHGIRYFLIPYLILLAICLFIKLSFTKSEIYFAVNARHTDFLDKIAPYVTDLGDGWTTIIIAVVLLLVCSYRKAFLLASSYALTGGVFAQVLKFAVNAPRPSLYFKDQWSRIHFVKGVHMLSTHSFPSGHTITAFSTAMVILYLAKNKGWGLLLLIIAICVGYSRMYLSQHFFEDVTVGSIVGVVVTVIWVNWIDSKPFLRKPGWNRALFKRS